MNAPQDALEALRARQSSLPFITAHVPAVQGELKQSPEDFVVEELPAYLPAGTGEHLYLWVEKRNVNTQDAARSLARTLDTRPENVGWAGLKDRHAVTRQWISFQCPKTPTPESFDLEGIRVLEVARHNNKLRTGHLRGNRFQLRLANVPEEQDVHVTAALDELQRVGLPTYFGGQRFGYGGKNLNAAYAWIVGGERAPQKPFLRKLFVSTLQSALFNIWLAERIEARELTSAIAGDILRKEESGGLFNCDDPQTDTPRVESWEISVTGPMFGSRMRAPHTEALAREQALLEHFGVTEAHLTRVERAGEGTRRPARVRPEQVSMVRVGSDLSLDFTLPRGAYATELVSEIFKIRDFAAGEED